MKPVHKLFLAVALATLAMPTLHAQTVSVKTVIPFRFTVGRVTLPAGEYAVRSLDDRGTGSGLLELYNLRSKATNILISDSCQSASRPDRSKLVFHRYGHRYFLNQVWIQGNSAGREFHSSPAETEIAKKQTMQRMTLIASSR